MYQQDYILRLIEQVGAVLRRMALRIAEGRAGEALEDSGEALGLVLEMDPRFVESLSGASLVSLLGAGGRLDAKRALLLGQVFARRAEARGAAGDADGATAERDKAAALLTAVADLGDREDARRADDLLGAPPFV
ncbi:MAG: hypothetical protein IBX62_06735 [Coriobacteriia bacterium]|nr:hypothetical protein [Coriobacteriia bacterium]